MPLYYSRLLRFALLVVFSIIFIAEAHTQEWPEHVISGYHNARNAELHDLDNDGDLDVVMVSSSTHNFVVMHVNDGNQDFSERRVLVNGTFLEHIIHDLDQDGDLDLLLANSADEIQWASNNGDGTFSELETLADFSGNASIDPDIEDMDDDGDPDLVVSLYTDDEIWLIENLGNGSFSDATLIVEDAILISDVKAGDITNDGLPDLITVESVAPWRIYLFEQAPDGSFPTKVEVGGSGSVIADIELADINADGNLDILSGSTYDDLGWLRNQGNGTFTFQIQITNSEQVASSVNAVDMDDDGDLDVLFTTFSDYEFGWYEQDDDGFFNTEHIIEVSEFSLTASYGDVDGDGDLDVISTRGNSEVIVDINDGNQVFSNELIITNNTESLKSMFLMDSDQDGDLDYFSSHFNDGEIVMRENIGHQSYAAERDVTSLNVNRTIGLAGGDLNGDGLNDLVATTTTGEIRWAMNQGGNDFSDLQILETGLDSPNLPSVIDLDLDGDLDVLFKDDSRVWWMSNDGTGLFETPTELSGSYGMARYECADMDDDGDLDVVGPVSNWDTVTLLENDGNMNFSQNVLTDNLDAGIRLQLEDMDNDGDRDIVCSGFYQNVYLFRNLGGGSFSPPQQISNAVPAPRGLEAADFNSDGLLDIITSSWDGLIYLENTGNGVFADSQIVSDETDDVIFLQAVDVNVDSSIDVVAYNDGDSELVWYDNKSRQGCTDPSACNFEPTDLIDDGSCCFDNCGCTDPLASNYDASANCETGTCLYTVQGTVFHDLNGNGIWDVDQGELPLTNQTIGIPELLWTALTDDNGQFLFSGLNSLNYFAEVDLNDEFPYATTNLSVNLNEIFDPSNVLFGLSTDIPATAICLDFYPPGNGYPCNDWVNHNLCFRNMGNYAFDGILEINLNPLFQDYSAVTPIDSVQGNTVYMSFSNLPPGQMLFYDIQLLTPTVDYIGEFIASSATIYATYDDEIVAQTTTDLEVEMTCSYDPNDKQAFPQGYEEPHLILNETEIEYLIRFQNTGNAPATHVLITDTIDENLDMASFQLMANSHSVQTSVKQNERIIEFYFENIMLPDSTNNEPESHGLVSFKITPFPNRTIGTEINNTGNIFFDNNPPIITNTTWHTIHECGGEAEFTTNASVICDDVQVRAEALAPYLKEVEWVIGEEIISNDFEYDWSVQQDVPFTLSLNASNPLCAESQSVIIDQDLLDGLLPCKGDYNCSGTRDSNDLLFFLGDFGCSGDCETDLNFDDLVNAQDLILFLSLFGVDCLSE